MALGTTPLMAWMRARPEEFRRGRSLAVTLVGGVAGFACLALAVLTMAKWPAFVDLLTSDSSRARFDGAGPFFAWLFPPVLISAGVGLLRWAILPNGGFTRVATGTPVRQLALIGFQGDSSVITSLREAFESKQPAAFLPLPPTQGRANTWIDVWVAEADRMAYALVTPGASRRIQAAQPAQVLEGEAFDALLEAHAAGRLQAPAAQSSLAPFRVARADGSRTGRTEFLYDVGYASSLITRARRRGILSLAAAALGVLLTVWSLTDNENLGFIIPGGVATILGATFALISRQSYITARSGFGTLTGRLITIDDSTISFETRPGIRWTDVIAIGVLDRRRMIGETTDRPHRDWGETIGHTFSRGAGIGVVTLSFVVADAEAADGPRPGQILLTPDSVLSLDETARLVAELNARAVSRDIPMIITADPAAYRKVVFGALGLERYV